MEYNMKIMGTLSAGSPAQAPTECANCIPFTSVAWTYNNFILLKMWQLQYCVSCAAAL